MFNCLNKFYINKISFDDMGFKSICLNSKITQPTIKNKAVIIGKIRIKNSKYIFLNI